ncbi:YafY family transcriptional regulator [Streptomyces sp. A7024]|uniref:YafY family transcriptional regulator n=1 Tax=Streptomyces coryli TaxID=1128680 RepID=A0A6G4TWU2_9ACTN|nr:YafY family protein [Streptomyces coryli]NGN64445.1 YafY family transcriptional regulator [Streptomyces coryli]
MTTDTPKRLLNLLSLLQTPREWPGSELADRLSVSTRTIRRDIDRLRDLGYPVEASQGAIGGYRLVAGAALPPLLLEDDEAVAIAVGLRAAAGQSVEGVEEASVRALAKLEQVLPSRLRRRVKSLGTATTTLTRWRGGPSIDPAVLTTLATAAAAREKLRFGYRAADGTETKRLVEPEGLVSAGRRWYFLAFDLDRTDWRIFRVDRITKPFLTAVRFTPRTLPAKDAATYIGDRMSSQAPPSYAADVTLHAPYRELAPRLGDSAANLERIDDTTCRYRTEADSVDWLAARLAILGCAFEVHEPRELVDYLAAMATRVSRAVSPSSSSA